MKYFYSLILLLALGTACKQKVLSGKELEDKLKETMTEHLHKTLKPGTEFTIKDMTYYADKIKKYYICTFDVTVHSGNKDTSGVMKAFIPNDFSKVDRTQ
jgi:hypothetical protein